MFTRQHYEKLAKFIDENRTYSDYSDSVRWAIDDLCEFFQLDNPRFNSTTFRKACGLVWNETKEEWEEK